LLDLVFEGWAQCRLATDPDPSDEPRGVSGWTFAVAGEPDLDRVLRLQPDGATERSPGPAIGVRVTNAQPGTPLHDARILLLDNPVFDGRNGLANEDTREPIVPIHLRVEGDGVAIQRRHLDPSGRPLSTLPVGLTAPPPQAAQNIGVATPPDRTRFRNKRAEALRTALRSATSDIEKAALKRRLRPFDEEEADPSSPSIQTQMLGVALKYEYTLTNSDGLIEDPSSTLGPLDHRSPWQLGLTVGIWDADALCAWIHGTLHIP
jgi:hypothetical protein